MKKIDRTARELPSIDDIIQDYERMFADSDDPSTLAVQGTIFGRKGRFEDAIRHFDKAIDIDSSFLDAWFNNESPSLTTEMILVPWSASRRRLCWSQIMLMSGSNGHHLQTDEKLR